MMMVVVSATDIDGEVCCLNYFRVSGSNNLNTEKQHFKNSYPENFVSMEHAVVSYNFHDFPFLRNTVSYGIVA